MKTKSRILIAAALALAFTSCSASTPKPLEVRDGAPGTATVVGRIQMYKDGARLHVGPRSRPLVGWIQGPKPLSSVGLRAQANGKVKTIAVEDADGWFVAHLAPGRYSMGLQYYVY